MLPPPLTIPGQKFPFLGCLDEGSQAKGWTMPEMMTHLCFSEGFWGGKKGNHLLSSVVPHGTWNLEVSGFLDAPALSAGRPPGLYLVQMSPKCALFLSILVDWDAARKKIVAPALS